MTAKTIKRGWVPNNKGHINTPVPSENIAISTDAASLILTYRNFCVRFDVCGILEFSQLKYGVSVFLQNDFSVILTTGSFFSRVV